MHPFPVERTEVSSFHAVKKKHRQNRHIDGYKRNYSSLKLWSKVYNLLKWSFKHIWWCITLVVTTIEILKNEAHNFSAIENKFKMSLSNLNTHVDFCAIQCEIPMNFPLWLIFSSDYRMTKAKCLFLFPYLSTPLPAE